MPAIRSLDIVNAILDAIAQSGETGLPISPIRKHPRVFAISGPSGDAILWVYAWTLTFGGRPSLPNEYRIQMMSVESPLAMNSDGLTLLIGYEPDWGVFAGFDLQKHQSFTSGSPSVQIDGATVRQALQDGLAFHKKSNDEVAVGIRPDQFMAYASHAALFHRYGRHGPTLEALNRASSRQPIQPVDLDRLPPSRRRLVETVSRLSRAANFREQVLNGYARRCAVTRLQLKLVDAAHILPVAAPESMDHIVNGITLSPTYHRAFDNGLIFLTEEYVMRINDKQEKMLRRQDLAGGMEVFKASLGKIHFPADPAQRPDIELIRKANKFRGIA